jgi:hypothetical protein
VAAGIAALCITSWWATAHTVCLVYFRASFAGAPLAAESGSAFPRMPPPLVHVVDSRFPVFVPSVERRIRTLARNGGSVTRPSVIGPAAAS